MSETHLARYTAEFNFRYNTRKMNDTERADAALMGAVGKRFTYRRANAVQCAATKGAAFPTLAQKEGSKMSDDTMAVAFAGLNASIMTACVLTERGLLKESDLAAIHDSIIEAAEEFASPEFLNVMRERTDESFVRLKLEAQKHGKGAPQP